jgi:ABC-type amino acid transport system permease subunit
MVMNLVAGLPDDRPGGLVLTIAVFVAAGFGAVVFGFLYATVCVGLPRLSLALQAAAALLRGIPLLLLVFLFAHLPEVPKFAAGLGALVVYSFVHVGETLRSFLAAYPTHLREQARVVGLGPVREWLQLRIPWTFWRALAALGTHWVSLLKDTGALVVLGIGELTTVAKVLSEGPYGDEHWIEVMLWAGALYLSATLALIQAIEYVTAKLGQLVPSEERTA